MGARLFPIWLAAALATLAMISGFAWGGSVQEQWQLAARYTARVGFPLFLLAYAASSLVRLWPHEATRNALRHRRQWGLSFALTHSVHLIALTAFNMIANEVPALVTLIGGGGAYGIMYMMALTSNDRSMRALGRWWKRLHTIGIHWIWFIFAFTYFGRVLDPAHRTEGIVFFGLAMAAAALRLWAWSKTGPTSAQRASMM
jgi:DMSO/TMAO reductase YedYZ heme-binding membrane subunit